MRVSTVRSFLRALSASGCVAALVATVGAQTPPAALQPVPEGLEEVIFGARKQRQVDARLNGVRFRAIPTIGAHPDLAWPASADFALAKDRATVDRWLIDAGPGLGHGAFATRFVEVAQWRGRDVWVYEFVHDGVPMLDYRLRVYWDGDRFLGLANHFPGPVRSVEPAAVGDRAATNRAYYAERDGGGFRAVLATLQREVTRQRTVTTVRTAKGVAYRLHEAEPAPIGTLGAASFQEYTLPTGVFPDQIWADAKGLIWFSQPNSDLITSFDPVTQQFQSVSTQPGSGADGLMVDDQDRVWTGLYYTAELGYLDVPTGQFVRIPMPYSPSNPAIPTMSINETVWVTDHQNNRISEWDPVGQAWLQSLTMPIPACWVVAGVLDQTRGTVWFTEYSANHLGAKPLGQPIFDVPVPAGGGPAFLAYNDDKVYYSLWINNRLGEYDVVTQQFTEYAYAVGETGGPLFMMPNGKVVVGTRNNGVIAVFDPVTKTFQNYPIPTTRPGLKDGLTVSQDGVIWFTESGVNKIAKLVLP